MKLFQSDIDALNYSRRCQSYDDALVRHVMENSDSLQQSADNIQLKYPELNISIKDGVIVVATNWGQR